MSETKTSLARKIGSAGDLQSVVRTMKALAASSITQYEQAMHVLGDYNQAVEQGLGACFRQSSLTDSGTAFKTNEKSGVIAAIIFGSDQGLVGQFNDRVAEFAMEGLEKMSGSSKRLWAVGTRLQARLTESGITTLGTYALPESVKAIAPLVGQILVESEVEHIPADVSSALYLFYNRPTTGATYEPVQQRLLPLDHHWHTQLEKDPWPAQTLPQVMGTGNSTLRALIREYLFVSLFRACAASLASENASRLAAMQRAEKNIEELLEELHSSYHRLRQSSIDEELFDVISGFEALS